MTAKIKLNAASGGGSFSLQAPSSSSNNRVMTLPDTADGTVLTTTNPKAGNIIQVKSAAKTDATSIASSGGNIFDISGLSVDITASATGNKMLIMAMVSVSSSSSGMGTLLIKDSSNIFVGDTSGSRGRLTTNVENQGNSVDCKVVPITFLDTAADTNSHTYKIGVFETDGATNTFYINRGTSDSDQANRARVVSSITVMEVAA